MKIFVSLLTGVCLFYGKVYAQQAVYSAPALTKYNQLASALLKINIASRNNVNYLQEKTVAVKNMQQANSALKTGNLSLHQSLQPDYHITTLGFMCKKELEFEKATKIPLRFRLGSLQYCNMLEGK